MIDILVLDKRHKELGYLRCFNISQAFLFLQEWIRSDKYHQIKILQKKDKLTRGQLR